MSKDVTVEVFYSPTCQNCPPQKQLVRKFESDDVKVRLTDVSVENRRAKKHGVRAVPTTVVDGPQLDGKVGFRGLTSEERLETAVKAAKGELPPEELEKEGIIGKVKNLL